MKPSELYLDITGRTGVYNIQAIDNIPSIMKRGILSNEKAAAIEHISIAMNEIQNRRDGVFIPNGMPLHRYANAYFDSRNPMLFKRKDEKENLCILKIDRKILDLDGVIVSDCNAASRYAGFYSPEIGLKEIDFRLVFATDWRDENLNEYYKKKSIKCAEILVPYVIPYRFVTAVAVSSFEASQKLEKIGFDKTIVVEPQQFF